MTNTNNTNRFAHLHVHDSFSIADGVGKIADYIKKIKIDGQDTLAITNHGNLYSAVDFYFKAKEAGINPIIGEEFYVVRDRFSRGGANDIAGKENKDDPRNLKKRWHLIILAENNEGYQNLLKLHASANCKEAFYYKPRIDFAAMKKYSKGLICLSACLGGEINQSILMDDYDWTEEAIERHIDIFGKDNFFLEVQNHGLKEDQKILKTIPRFAAKYGVKIVATNDAHYCNKEDKIIQDAIFAIKNHKLITDSDVTPYKDNDNYYIKTRNEMSEIFKENPEYLENAYQIGQRCKVDLKYDKVVFPEFIEGKEKKEELLKELCREGWKKFTKESIGDDKERKKVYANRVKYELDVINKNGFTDYFLIVQDFVNYAKKQGVPVGGGRGSVGGALIAYLLGITDLDPIQYGLYFERFLNPSRISAPDIDVDFADNRRQEVIEYIRNKYGVEKFAATITFTNFQAKASLRDALKIYGYDVITQLNVTRLVPTVLQGVPNIRFKHLYDESTEYKNFNRSEFLKAKDKYPEAFSLAEKLEGLPRSRSTHASAYIITDKPLSDYAPIDFDSKSGMIRTGIDMYSCDKMKLLKLDLLGIETLAIVANAIQKIKERYKVVIDKKKIKEDDSKTWDLIKSGDTIGIFQFESDGMRNLLKKSKPINLNELAECNGIYRPGAAKFIPDYIAIKNGTQQPAFIHPLMEPVLKDSNFTLIFQESVMKMCEVLAGFTPSEADYMRKAIGKKKEEDMVKLVPMFEKGCQKNDIPKETTDEILSWFSDMSRYNFNKSHALGYSKDAYYAAYIKANYPIEFAVCMLNKKAAEMENYFVRVNDAKKRGLKVNGPDIGVSEPLCSLNGNEISFGLDLIKGTSSSSILAIVEERNKSGQFKSFEDFISRTYEFLDKNTLEGLALSGALDSLKIVRKYIAENSAEYIKIFQKEKKKDKDQLDMFVKEGSIVIPKEMTVFKGYVEFEAQEKLTKEKEVIGFRATGSLLDEYRDKLFDDDFYTTQQINSMGEQEFVKLGGIIEEVKRIKDKNGKDMAFITVEDDFGKTKCVIFSTKFNSVRGLLKVQNPIKLIGFTSNGSILVNNMKSLKDEE